MPCCEICWDQDLQNASSFHHHACLSHVLTAMDRDMRGGSLLCDGGGVSHHLRRVARSRTSPVQTTKRSNYPGLGPVDPRTVLGGNGGPYMSPMSPLALELSMDIGFVAVVQTSPRDVTTAWVEESVFIFIFTTVGMEVPLTASPETLRDHLAASQRVPRGRKLCQAWMRERRRQTRKYDVSGWRATRVESYPFRRYVEIERRKLQRLGLSMGTVNGCMVPKPPGAISKTQVKTRNVCVLGRRCRDSSASLSLKHYRGRTAKKSTYMTASTHDTE